MIMEDEIFGNLKLDDSGAWSGVMTLANGETAKFDVGEAAGAPLTEAARNSIRFVMKNEPLMRLKIAAAMTELYEDWNDNETTTPEELARRYNLDTVTFWEDGGGQLYYTAGDIYAGHWVCVMFDENGDLDEPELAG